MSLKGRYMKSFFVAVIFLAVLPAHIGRAQAQSFSGDHSFLLRLPPTVDTTGIQINFFMTGDFGGYGAFVRTKPNFHDYVIDTSYENKPAETLKIIVYCPGYAVKLIEVPSLADSSSSSAFVELDPLPSLRLSGRIVAPEERDHEDFKMEVIYFAYWAHEFFGIMDGAVTTFKIASVDVKQDGYFSIEIPDFARDPAVASFKRKEWLERKGLIELRARDPKTGAFVYRLQSAEHPGKDAEIEIATKYNELLLYAKPYK
jgi:hypothetical protein